MDNLGGQPKLGVKGQPQVRGPQASKPKGDKSESSDSGCSCPECTMALVRHCGLEANVIEHHDNYRRSYACCPKRVCVLCNRAYHGHDRPRRVLDT